MVRKERKNAQKDAQIAPKTSPPQSELLGTFYRPCWCIGSGPANVSNFVLMHFFSFEFGRAFGGFPGIGLRLSWCSWKALDV